MNDRLSLLAAQRERLVARAADQRALLGDSLAELRAPLEMVDRGIAILGFFRNHTALSLAVASLAVVLKPRRAALWLKRGWLTWRLTHGVRRLAAHFAPSKKKP